MLRGFEGLIEEFNEALALGREGAGRVGRFKISLSGWAQNCCSVYGPSQTCEQIHDSRLLIALSLREFFRPQRPRWHAVITVVHVPIDAQRLVICCSPKQESAQATSCVVPFPLPPSLTPHQSYPHHHPHLSPPTQPPPTQPPPSLHFHTHPTSPNPLPTLPYPNLHPTSTSTSACSPPSTPPPPPPHPYPTAIPMPPLLTPAQPLSQPLLFPPFSLLYFL